MFSIVTTYVRLSYFTLRMEPCVNLFSKTFSWTTLLISHHNYSKYGFYNKGYKHKNWSFLLKKNPYEENLDEDDMKTTLFAL